MAIAVPRKRMSRFTVAVLLGSIVWVFGIALATFAFAG
jgi:hypothetical protein